MDNETDVLKQILDGSNQMIIVCDAFTLEMMYANAPIVQSSFHKFEPYEGRKCYEYMMGYNMQCPFCPLRKMGVREESQTEVENGNRYFSVKTKPINWHGKTAFIEYLSDISNIRRSENLYRTEIDAIIKSIDKAKSIFHLDLDSDKVLSITGLPGLKERVKGLTAKELIVNGANSIPKEKDKDLFINTFTRESLYHSYSSGKMNITMDTEWKLSEKNIRNARFVAELILNPVNSHLECIIFSLDTTEEVKMKREMEITNKLNEALVCDFTTIFIINLHDGTMNVRKMDTTQNAFKLGLPPVIPFNYFFKKYAENFILEEYRDDILKEINVANLRKKVDNGESNFSVRYKVIKNDNGEENFEAVVLPVTLDDPYHLVVGCKCIDNLIAREEHDKKILREARIEAEQANRAKTSFLFNMSHDIRTPMNAIMGFTNLLEKHQNNPKLRKDYLSKIADSSNILLSIINNVLEMARIEKGTIELEESAWSADLFNEQIYTLFSDMMKQKKIKFTRKMNIQHPYVMCDPTKLREVFFNIISNSFKYTPMGGKIHMQVDELPYDREGYAFFRTTITDNGRGMSKEFLPHVFEEFTREQNTTHTKIQGTGLGMPIVKRLVEIMDGTIEVQSEQGVGTTVIVHLPHRITEATNTTPQQVVEQDSNLLKGKRILLAEDNDINAEIAIEILSEYGLIVEHADNGEHCVEMLQKASDGYYDLILMDVQMPVMNGYEATRFIRQMEDKVKANIPIVAMTANAFEEDKRESLRSGMNDHVAKPIDVSVLLSTLLTNLA